MKTFTSQTLRFLLSETFDSDPKYSLFSEAKIPPLRKKSIKIFLSGAMGGAYPINPIEFIKAFVPALLLIIIIIEWKTIKKVILLINRWHWSGFPIGFAILKILEELAGHALYHFLIQSLS